MNGVWNANASIKAIDFAGGTVVHMSSGWSAIVLALIVGKRRGFGKESFAPHSLVLTMVGTGMLWVGWYGFNAGSAVAADAIAANAFVTTTVAAAVACVAWPAAEWLTRGKPTVLGFCSGAVGGLVVITPAAGFVTPGGALIIGVLAGVVPFLACTKLKNALGYDDALDTFGVHAVGGTMGALLTGFLATANANPNLNTNLKDIVGKTLWLEQLKAMGFTIVLAAVVTAALAYALKATIGLRPTEEDEEIGPGSLRSRRAWLPHRRLRGRPPGARGRSRPRSRLGTLTAGVFRTRVGELARQLGRGSAGRRATRAAEAAAGVQRCAASRARIEQATSQRRLASSSARAVAALR